MLVANIIVKVRYESVFDLSAPAASNLNREGDRFRYHVWVVDQVDFCSQVIDTSIACVVGEHLEKIVSNRVGFYRSHYTSILIIQVPYYLSTVVDRATGYQLSLYRGCSHIIYNFLDFSYNDYRVTTRIE